MCLMCLTPGCGTIPARWELNDDLFKPVSDMLVQEYGISHERLSQQLVNIAEKLVNDYRVLNHGVIQVDRSDGSSYTARVEHLDDYHFDLGEYGNVYHICQFGEMMERTGPTAYPEIQTQDEQGAWELGGKGYLAIQSCEDGWDYGRFDFDPTELKNARARNAAANAAAAEFERQEQEKADKEASNAGKTFAVVAQEYIASNRSRMAPSVRLKGDYDSNRNKENTSLKKEKYLQRIQCYPEFSEKPIALITKKDCDTIIRFIEDSDARVYKRAVLKSEAKEFKTMSCPKIAKKCTIREETIERIFRGETVSLDSAQQVAAALGKTVEQMFEVEIDRRPMTKKTMREYNLFIRSVLNYANDNYGTSLQMPMIKASGRKGKSVDCLHSDEVEALQAALKECSMLEKAIVLCLLNTGVRRGELAGLTWKDVNFRDGTIHVSKSLLVFPNYGYQLTTTKESNIRDVDVAPEFMAFLKDYHEQWKSRKKLMGASWQKNLEKKGAKYAQSLLDLRGNDFVICNDYGFPINPDSYAALVRRVGKKAGIEKIHPHMFRHTFVSILLSNPNIGVATVAAEAGHAQPSTTLAIYTQVYDRRRDEIRKQMSKELYK